MKRSAEKVLLFHTVRRHLSLLLAKNPFISCGRKQFFLSTMETFDYLINFEQCCYLFSFQEKAENELKLNMKDLEAQLG